MHILFRAGIACVIWGMLLLISNPFLESEKMKKAMVALWAIGTLALVIAA